MVIGTLALFAAPSTHAQVEGDFSAGGGIRIGTSTSICDGTLEGSLRYNSTNKCLQLCDGANWACISVGACVDATPDAFDFTNLANQTLSTLVESNILQITGLGCIVNVAISGEGSPQFRTCTDGTTVPNCDGSVVIDWTSASGTISDSEYIQVRLTTSAAGGDTFSATLTIGNGVDVWNAATTGDCTGSPAPGTVCADGTVFAGMSPDGNVKMFVTRCDAGQTWDGSICTGARAPLTWNDGNTNFVATGFISVVTGETNTSNIVTVDSNSSLAGSQPHVAAEHCNDLTQDGYTDWYLPAINELDLIRTNNSAIGHFDTGGAFYWSSSDGGANCARRQRFSDGFIDSCSFNTKPVARNIRCARK